MKRRSEIISSTGEGMKIMNQIVEVIEKQNPETCGAIKGFKSMVFKNLGEQMRAGVVKSSHEDGFITEEDKTRFINSRLSIISKIAKQNQGLPVSAKVMQIIEANEK